MRRVIVGLLLTVVGVLQAVEPHDYRKAILGCWLGPRKFDVYHADGTWGVKRNEDAPEDKQDRRWQIRGDKLTLTYPGDYGTERGVWTIIMLTDQTMILEIDGHRTEYRRYSPDCQTKDLTRRCS